MILTDFLDASVRLALVLLTLSSLVAIQVFLTTRMIMLPETPSAPSPLGGGIGESTRHRQE